MRVSVGEYELADEVIGSGDPVSLLHWGMFGDRRQLRPMAELLPGTRILLDGRAYGESDAPSTPYSLEDYADHVAVAVRTVAPGPCVLIGQSMAGMTFLRLALAYPELVMALVFIDSSAAPEDPELAPTYEALLAELIDSGPSAELLDFVAEASLMSPSFVAEHDIDRWRELRDLLPDVRGYVEIPGAGHFAAWEKPRPTAEAVGRFLEEVAAC